MSKIKSLEELKKIRELSNQDLTLRTTGENPERTVIAVGMATCGIAAGAREVMSALLQEINGRRLTNVSVVATGCLGFCYAEPMMEVRKPGESVIRYGNVTPDVAKEILEKHVLSGEFVVGHIFTKGVSQSE